MKPSIIVILLLTTLLTASTGWGDIYRHDDGSDTISFTDAPHDSRYTLIMRDRQPKITKSNKTSIRPTVAKTESAAARSASQEPSLANELPLQGVITSTTGYRNDPFDGKLKHHNGMDIAAPSGTPVKPVAPGTVVFSGWRNGYGNSVIIEHDDSMVTIYAHHSSNQVSEGATVDRSTVIALSGSTGRSTGPHLHFEAWRNGENITPTFLPAGTQQHQAVAAAPVRRYLQPDGTILFTNLR
ncbi:M23 family metallopeptidase [Geobacter pelophilus]|uniref:M23 family metallopeptidase n=1 Tax=Geoanaerobacter pelophilus TaxID=60036 RepID=A0AAW4L2D8_9BACT|nr:M23 family metallopeptidase [Geoanaerobacter pelophilus]MBT0664367.1 M23 family metallopeptidase [Geoanaerobacter pelophilus]